MKGLKRADKISTFTHPFNLTIMTKNKVSRALEDGVEYFIFASRWFQAPIYLGLILASAFYVYKFFVELLHVAIEIESLTEVDVMLAILGLIDISMVMNLLIIVIIGGYSIFTSRIDFTEHEDRPHWLDHLDAGKLKIKLATSLASISGVHLLKTFIDIHREIKGNEGTQGLVIEIVIHLVFIISALLLAWVEKILVDTEKVAHQMHTNPHIAHPKDVHITTNGH